MFLIEALILGLMGSFHCVGMCGPIAIALPLNNDTWLTRITGSLLYNTGRTLTYTLMGIIFGLVGLGLKMGGLQQWVSILMGTIMILSVLVPALFQKSRFYENTINRFTRFLSSHFHRLFMIRSNTSLLTIGILNGFLPCGLVYIAIAGAMATGDIINGALFMVLFGLGTIPMLFLLNIAGNIVSARFRSAVRKVIPFFIIIIGILFILRGMNLGIKYISPKDGRLQPKTEQMHH
jgi:hypothetical protein